MRFFGRGLRVYTFRAGVVVFLWCTASSSLAALPSTMYHDTTVLHDVEGPTPFTSASRKERLSLDIIPYYHYTSRARDERGDAVPEGDRLGRWNMIGLLHGTSAAPGGALSGGSTPTLLAASRALSRETSSGGFGSVTQTYTDNNFTDSTQNFGYFSVPIHYEKYGIRAKVRCELGGGFCITLKGGFASYKQAPEFIDKTSSATVGFTTPSAVNFSFTTDQVVTQTHLMERGKFEAIAQEIGLDIERFSETVLEDTHVMLSWHRRFAMHDEYDRHVVTVVPCVAIGATLATAPRKDQDKAFSLSMGNDGFSGVAIRGALSFDFVQGLHTAIGAQALLFGTTTRGNYRVPTNDTQSTIYPWKARVRKRLGSVWSLQAGFKAEDFLENLSFFGTYVYTRREPDGITMADTTERNALFKPTQLERESAWESQVFHAGLQYYATPNMALSVGVVAPITGKRIYRTVTALGSIKLAF